MLLTPTSLLDNDVDSLLRYIETFGDAKRDLPASAVEIFIRLIINIKMPSDRSGRTRMRAFCNKMVGKINKNARPLIRFPGLAMLIEPLEAIRLELEKVDTER